MPVIPYQHSGRSGNALLIPFFGIPVALLLSIPYSYMVVYNPCLSALTFLITLGFGALCGLVVGRAAKAGKVRSRGTVTLMGGLVGLAALYGSWVVFTHALLEKSTAGTSPGLLTLFFTPQAVWSFAVLVAQNGWFNIKGTTISGVLLWLAWAAEALTIVGAAAIIPRDMLRNWVFCETCNKWCVEKDALARFSDPGPKAAQLKAGDLSALAGLTLVPEGQKVPHVRINNRRCDTCGQTESIQIERVRYEKNDKGNLEEKTERLTEHLLLDAPALTELQSALVAGATPQVV